MTKIKVGILGAGGIAKVHLNNLKQDERVEVVGIADLQIDRAKSLATEVGPQTNAVRSLDELINLHVDAIYVTTPNTLHAQPVIKCLENNIHVFSEKPMATTIKEAEQIRDAASRSKGIYNLGMNMRVSPAFRKVKELISSNEVTPYMANIKLNRGELLNPVWTADPNVTGGYLYETPIHLFDIARYLFGEVKTVKCEARSNISNVEFDDFAVLLTFESGTIATFVSSAHAGWGYPFQRFEVYGEYSTVTVEEMEKVIYSPGLKQSAKIQDFHQVQYEEKWGYFQEDKIFIDAIVNDTKPLVNAQDGFMLTSLLEKVYESAKTGKEIIL